MTTQNAFSKHILFLLLVNLVVKPTYLFIIEVSVQNSLGPKVYGLYFALFNVTYLFNVLLDLGIQNRATHLLASENESETDMGQILGVKLLLAVGYIITVMFSALVLGYSGTELIYISLLAFYQSLITLVLYFQAAVTAKEYYWWNTVLSILDKTLLIIVLSIFLFIKPFNKELSLTTFILAQLCTISVTAIVSASVAFQRQIFTLPQLNINKVKKLLKQSLPYAAIILLMGCYMRIDGVMLERVLLDGGTQAGYYAASHRLYAGLNNLGYLFSLLLFPMFIRLSNRRDALKSLFQESTISLIAIGATAAIFVIFFRTEIMHLLYGQDAVDYGTEALTLLMITFVMACIVNVFGTLLTARRQFGPFIRILGVGATLNIALNFYLIPRTGMIGACWSTLICHVALSGALLFLMRQEIEEKTFLFKTMKLGIYLLMIFLVHFSMKELISERYWIVSASISLLISLVLCFQGRFFGTFLWNYSKA